MKRSSSSFLTLLFALLTIGAFDLDVLFSSHGSAVGGSWPVAYAAPLSAASQTQSTKARIGIVVTSGASSTKPLNTITTSSSNDASAFKSTDGRIGMKVQLKRMEPNKDSNPLMVSTTFPRSFTDSL